jgi:hypothetical protein
MSKVEFTPGQETTLAELVATYKPTVLGNPGTETYVWTRTWEAFSPKGLDKVELLTQLGGALHCIYITWEGDTPDDRPFVCHLNQASLEILLLAVDSLHRSGGFINPMQVAAFLVNIAVNYFGFPRQKPADYNATWEKYLPPPQKDIT